MHFIQKFKKSFKNHYLIIILGIFLTFLIEIPVISFPFIAEKDYQGINIPHFGSDSHFYLSRAKEALEGHNLGNPVLREGKDNQDTFLMYNEWALVAPFRFLGLSNINVVTLYNIYNFIGVFVLILLIYFLVLQFSGNKLLAITSAIFAIGGYHIVYKQFFYTDFNIYGRPMFPYISSLAFFIYLNFLTKWFKTKDFIYKILSAVSFGLLFYVYFFAWTFALALNGILFLLYFLKRNWIEVKSMLFISGIGIFIGLYNLIQMWILFHSNIGAQISYFHWSFHTYAPIFSKIGAAMLVFFSFFAYKKRNDTNIILIFALILAGWAALNQQIITGQVLQIGHYYWYFIVPLSIISGLYMAWVLLEGYAWRSLLFGFILLVVFLHSALGQYRSFFVTLPNRVYEQSYQPIISILKADAKPGVILAADDYSAYLFTIYTNHDLFWNMAASQTVIPFSRFTDALYVYMYLNKEARNDFSGFLNRIMEDTSSGSIYKGIYMSIEGFKSGLDYYRYLAVMNDKETIGAKRQELIATFSREYSNLVRDNHKGINDLLRKYGVNYIVWDKNRNPEWDLSILSGLKEVVSSNNIFLYQVDY